MIKIGDKSLETSVPADLDAKLVETTGCSAAELAEIVRSNPVAGLVARMISFCLVDPVDHLALAETIAAAGPAQVAVEVLTLLEPAPPASETTPAAAAVAPTADPTLEHEA